MRVAALVESADHVCCRYRVAAFRPYLEAAGHALTLHPLPAGPLARVRLFRSLRSADVVVLQRKLLPRLQFAVLRRSARRLVFDFDDAVWLRDSYSPKGLASGRRFRRFARTVRTADRSFTGNSYLAAAATRHTAAGCVTVVPTCIDPTAYGSTPPRPGGSLQLVWVGSSSTLRGLEHVRPLLDAVGAAVPGVRLKLICDRFARFARLPVDAVRWDGRTEAAELAAADVGIAWVPDDDWSRGKCGLKVLQYMATGLPVIANPVGVHTELVRPGETGFLAATADEWAAAVRALAADPDLRRRLGRAGRVAVEKRYSVEAGARLWVEALDRFVDDRWRSAG